MCKKELRMLKDYFKWRWWFPEEDGGSDSKIIIYDNGKEIELPYEITLSQEYNDDECMRVKYKGKYYCFG